MNSFKIGDKVVCIDDENFKVNLKLIKYKVYIVTDINNISNNINIVVNNENFGYDPKRFVTLKEFRNMKMNKIMEDE